jgi:hypothetical protein
VLAGAAVLELLFDALFEPLAAAPDDVPDDAPEPASEGAAALLFSLAAGLASAAVVPGATSAVLAPPLLLLRKSVTYQPEPLSWKPAAVTCLA